MKNGKETPLPKTTYSPEYIKEREQIDNLSRSVFNQMLQLNKRLEILQVTDFKFILNEPTKEVEKRLKWWQKVLRWLKTKLIK